MEHKDRMKLRKITYNIVVELILEEEEPTEEYTNKSSPSIQDFIEESIHDNNFEITQITVEEIVR